MQSANDNRATHAHSDIAKCFSPLQLEIINKLIADAIQDHVSRTAKAESAQWAQCFGPAAPADRAQQVSRIVAMASARAVCAQLNADEQR